MFVVTVPTPIDDFKKPDLSLIKKANSLIAKILKERESKGKISKSNKSKSTCPIIIYESTVFPGVTEEICALQIEMESGFKFNEEFFCGYSPERINPGDHTHRLSSIVKITSGSDSNIARWVGKFYGSIIEAGIHEAPQLKLQRLQKLLRILKEI